MTRQDRLALAVALIFAVGWLANYLLLSHHGLT